MSINKKAFNTAIDVLAGEFPPENGITIEILKRLCTAYEAAKVAEQPDEATLKAVLMAMEQANTSDVDTTLIPDGYTMRVLAEAAIAAIPTKRELRWRSTFEQYPPDEAIVIVDGGSAQWRDGKWFSGMEKPYYQREIQWEVKRWLPFSETDDNRRRGIR